jgi:hypothetical protein
MLVRQTARLRSPVVLNYRFGHRRNPMDQQRIAAFLADVLALANEEQDAQDALGDLFDGFALTVLITVAVGTIYYAIGVVKKLRRFT